MWRSPGRTGGSGAARPRTSPPGSRSGPSPPPPPARRVGEGAPPWDVRAGVVLHARDTRPRKVHRAPRPPPPRPAPRPHPLDPVQVRLLPVAQLQRDRAVEPVEPLHGQGVGVDAP